MKPHSPKTVAHFLFYTLGLFFISGCQRLDQIDYSPKITPEQFLQNQHWVKIKIGEFSFIFSQPSSTIIVYFVGFFTMYVGYNFLRNRNELQSKLWWGIGLLFTGLGALFAGTSYQAFGYEIKCSGREFCAYTSWWEIIYMLLSVPGMNAFLIATAYSSVKGKFKKAIVVYAALNTMVYFILVLYGVFCGAQFAVSFECMSLISAPGLLLILLLHGFRNMATKRKIDLVLLKTWLIFVAVAIAYGTYLSAGFATQLWQHGIWFTENDVLHAGMICWVCYINNKLRDVLTDLD